MNDPRAACCIWPPTFVCSHYIEFLLVHIADAYETSKMLCEQYYLTSPDMEITEVNCMLPYLANVGEGGRATLHTPCD